MCEESKSKKQNSKYTNNAVDITKTLTERFNDFTINQIIMHYANNANEDDNDDNNKNNNNNKQWCVCVKWKKQIKRDSRKWDHLLPI